ncbi:MAG TPA: thioredoxin domain-containing protein [Gemmatimonadaceae bacterium]|nr:thioredoxin domain-containing protein [Gemmatimonadaceae bacterium]
MAKDRMDAGRGRSGQQVKQQGGKGAPGAKGASGGKKVPVRSNDRKPFYLLLGAIALAAVVFIGWQMTQTKSFGVITVDPTIQLPEASGYLIGSATAPVEILEFADFECPACGSFATLTEPDVRKRLVETGQARFRFMDFPLAIHKNTWDAHMAAACANEQGKFWEMHDQIFATQDQWNGMVTNKPKAVLSRLARDLQINMSQWDECYDSQKYKLNIAATQREGERRLVQSTPTFIIGDKLLPGAIGFDQVKAYVDSAAAKAAASPVTPLGGDTALKKGPPPAKQ